MTRLIRAFAFFPLLPLLPLLPLVSASCDNDGAPGASDLAVPRDAAGLDSAVVDQAVPPDASPALDLAPILDFSPTDACTPNVGPGCCYPTCMLGEELICHGKNICGYPCECAAAPPDGGVPDVSADRPEVFQNCQPVIAPDPVGVTVSAGFLNQGNAPIGPIHLYGGHVLDAQGRELATFEWQPLKDFLVPAQQTVRTVITKAQGSGKPADGCSTLSCGSQVSVVFDYGPPGGKATRSVVSSLTTVSCVF